MLLKLVKGQICVLASILVVQLIVLYIVICFVLGQHSAAIEAVPQESSFSETKLAIPSGDVNISYNITFNKNIEERDAEEESSAPIIEEPYYPSVPIYNESTLRMLATTIYLEGSPLSDLEGHLSVGWTVRNRLYSDDFKYDTYEEVILAKYPCTQFSVTLLEDFDILQDEILEMTTPRAISAVKAARMVLEGENPYNFPEYVCFFYGDADKRNWNDLVYYDTFGGNSFFYKKEE